MAVTLFDGYPQAVGAKWEAVADVTGPTSYATGGFNLNAVSFGMSQIEFLSATGMSSNGTYMLRTVSGGSNKPSATVVAKAYLVSGGTEVTAATDLSAVHFRMIAFGV